ncbi:MAG: glycerophosphodiester phosphodiesterase [Hyphomicrobiales bacterium]
MYQRLVIACLSLVLPCSMALAFDLQGHRGARGLMPENTLPAFSKALSIGVTTLELDVGVTADGVVVVSHDPSLNTDLTRMKNGAWLTDSLLIKDQTFGELQAFDVGMLKPGSRSAKRFPDQQAVDGTRIPSLQEVFELAKASGNKDVRFNIESKISPLKPERTVGPDAFVTAILSTVEESGLKAQVTIQSFDWRTLQLVQKSAPEIDTVYLTAQQNWLDNVKSEDGNASKWTAGFVLSEYNNSVPAMVKAAGGSVWSPFYGDLTTELVKEAQALGLKVIPWTVNDKETMATLIDAGVDGIISDYPDRLRAVAAEKSLTLP